MMAAKLKKIDQPEVAKPVRNPDADCSIMQSLTQAAEAGDEHCQCNSEGATPVRPLQSIGEQQMGARV